MSLASKLKSGGLLSGTLVVFVGLGIDALLGLATNITLGRFLGSSGYGKVTTGLTILTMSVTFLMFGLDTAIPRFVPQRESKQGRQSVFFSSLLVVVPTATVVGVIGYLFSRSSSGFLGYSEQSILIFGIFALAIPFSAFSQLSVAYLRGTENPVMKVLIQNLFQPISVFLAVVLFVYFGQQISALAWGYVLVFVLSAAVAGFILWLTTDILHAPVLDIELRTLLKFSLPVIMTTAIKSIFTDIDIYLLGSLSGVQSVGVYKSGYVLGKFLGFTLMAFNFLFLPKISRKFEQQEMRKVEELYKRTTEWLVLFTFPPFFVLIVFPETVIRLTFGSTYLAATASLIVLAGAFFLHSIMGPNGTLLMSTGNVRFLFVATLAASLINIVLNVFLIPEFGILGAAVATFASYLFINAASMLFLRLEIRISLVSQEYVALVVSSLSITFIYILIGIHKNLGFMTRTLLFVALMLVFVSITFLSGAIDSDSIRQELIE